jgi:hypothetical protein
MAALRVRSIEMSSFPWLLHRYVEPSMVVLRAFRPRANAPCDAFSTTQLRFGCIQLTFSSKSAFQRQESTSAFLDIAGSNPTTSELSTSTPKFVVVVG